VQPLDAALYHRRPSSRPRTITSGKSSTFKHLAHRVTCVPLALETLVRAYREIVAPTIQQRPISVGRDTLLFQCSGYGLSLHALPAAGSYSISACSYLFQPPCVRRRCRPAPLQPHAPATMATGRCALSTTQNRNPSRLRSLTPARVAVRPIRSPRSPPRSSVQRRCWLLQLR
jgi:hypothetical protein